MRTSRMKQLTAIMLVATLIMVVKTVMSVGGQSSMNIVSSFVSRLTQMNVEPLKVDDSWKADNWIVVTTIASPTDDVKFLASLPGWRVMVVGDGKTPADWKHNNCYFLSLADQKRMGMETVQYIPEGVYGRKTAGYLMAIRLGAKTIYETDDDNRPLDRLKGFDLGTNITGMKWAGKGAFNPLRHFGQPTLWPRGFPLSKLGADHSDDYVLSRWRTPLVQQGVVNGDPDVDAIFRLTRKETDHKLDVTFDPRAPAVVVPEGAYASYNAQNTLHHYDAFWGLLLPVTVTFRVTDIWRGYWTQRMLWEMGGTMGYYGPNAYQVRNAHSYHRDFAQEDDLYYKTERLLEFLDSWECPQELSFFQCAETLMHDMVDHEFLADTDKRLVSAWFRDLRTLGYKEPARVKFSIRDEKHRLLFNNPKPLGDAAFSPDDHQRRVQFRAVTQDPYLPHLTSFSSPNLQQLRHVQHVQNVMSFCPNATQSLPLGQVLSTARRAPMANILLIAQFNFPDFYNQVPLLDMIYRDYFPNIMYCGDDVTKFKAATRNTNLTLTFVETAVNKGFNNLECVINAVYMRYNVDGYLMVSDDALLKPWKVLEMPVQKNWFPVKELRVIQDGDTEKWDVWVGPYGKRAVEASFRDLKAMGEKDPEVAKIFKDMQNNHDTCTKRKGGTPYGPADIYYIAHSKVKQFMTLATVFRKNNVYLEIGVPMLIYGMDPIDGIGNLIGKYIAGDDRNHLEKFYEEKDTFYHSVKLKPLMTSVKKREFLCKNFFSQLIVNH